MDYMLKHLRKDYTRCLKKVPDSPFRNQRLFVCYEDVLKAHYLICDYFEQTTGNKSFFGVRDFNLLGSALGRQIAGYGICVKWTEPLDICATLFFGLVKDHAFNDGNKRTALLILLFNLLKVNRMVTSLQKEFEKLTLLVASNKLKNLVYYESYKNTDDPEVRTISAFIRKNTRKLDKAFYSLTYKELDHRLKTFGCFLKNPKNNYIEVFAPQRYDYTFRFLGRRKVRKVTQIGFPGWTKQVSRKDINLVIKYARLTPENGIDSQVLFKNGEPMYRLIQDYEGPLRRLRDK